MIKLEILYKEKNKIFNLIKKQKEFSISIDKKKSKIHTFLDYLTPALLICCFSYLSYYFDNIALKSISIMVLLCFIPVLWDCWRVVGSFFNGFIRRKIFKNKNNECIQQKQAFLKYSYINKRMKDEIEKYKKTLNNEEVELQKKMVFNNNLLSFENKDDTFYFNLFENLNSMDKKSIASNKKELFELIDLIDSEELQNKLIDKIKEIQNKKNKIYKNDKLNELNQETEYFSIKKNKNVKIKEI
jgi:hypothetical protein